MRFVVVAVAVLVAFMSGRASVSPDDSGRVMQEWAMDEQRRSDYHRKVADVTDRAYHSVCGRFVFSIGIATKPVTNEVLPYAVAVSQARRASPAWRDACDAAAKLADKELPGWSPR